MFKLRPPMALFAVIALTWAPLTIAHMQMSQPFPIRSPLDPDVPVSMKDYSYTSPLNADGSNFPCKGYQNDRPIHLKAKYTAGSEYTLKLVGEAMHGGGSCQISLSYDNGKTFRVIESIIGGCPLAMNYNFTVPSFAPSGVALLAWTWFNHEGNREFYMNCAEVDVVSSSSAMPGKGKVSSKARGLGSFGDLPFIWKANIDINNCTTVEGEDPVFLNPGPQVMYGGSMSKSSPVTSGNCEDPAPPGKAYKNLAARKSGSVTAKTSLHSSLTSSKRTHSSHSTHSRSVVMSRTSKAHFHSTKASSSTTSATFRKPITTSKFYYRLIGNSTVSTVSSTGCTKTTTLYIPRTPSSTFKTTVIPFASNSTLSKTSSPPVAPSPTPVQISSPPQSLPYGTDSSVAFTPCEPGTFLCNSLSTFSQCVGGNSYVSLGSVAAGMMCLPHSSPNSGSTDSGVVTGGGPAGTHRDDKYVRAQPLGSCASDGSFECLRGGTGFAVCDNSAWVDMGPVAAGTFCQGSPGSAVIVAGSAAGLQ